MIPAAILKVFELIKKKFPINEAAEPKAIKTKEKPKVKKNCFKNYQISFFFFYFF